VFNSGFSEDRTLVSTAPIRSPILPIQPSESEASYELEEELEDSDLEDESSEANTLHMTEDKGFADAEDFITPSDELQQHSSLTGGAQGPNSQSTVGDETRRDSDEDDSHQNPISSQAEQGSPTLNPAPVTNATRRDESLDVVIVDSHRTEQSGPSIPGPPKTRVAITDVAYSTYRAVLYYVSGTLNENFIY
jgi:hypothetical protein